MSTKACPRCGARVSLANFDSHVARVHPREQEALNLSETERATLKDQAPAPSSRIRRRMSRPLVAALGALAVLVVAVILFVALMPNATGPMHIHPTLQVTVEGEERVVPADIGIDPALYRDHSLDQYSMMSTMAPLHTHDATGTIHVESSVTRDYTLAEFFLVWGESFSSVHLLGHPAPAGHRVRLLVDGAETPLLDTVILRDGMQVHLICAPA